MNHQYIRFAFILDERSFLSIIFPEKPIIQLKLSLDVNPTLIDIMHPWLKPDIQILEFF